MSQCRSKVVDERVAIGAAAPRLVGILLAVSALLAPQTTHFALEFGGIVVNHSMHGDFAMHTRGPRAPRQATEDIARSARLDCPLDGSPPLVDPTSVLRASIERFVLRAAQGRALVRFERALAI